MKFEIRIGKIYDIELKFDVPQKIVIISEAQKNILVFVANKRVDEKLNPIYEINGCEFEIGLSFSDLPYYKQAYEEENLSEIIKEELR